MYELSQFFSLVYKRLTNKLTILTLF